MIVFGRGTTRAEDAQGPSMMARQEGLRLRRAPSKPGRDSNMWEKSRGSTFGNLENLLLASGVVPFWPSANSNLGLLLIRMSRRSNRIFPQRCHKGAYEHFHKGVSRLQSHS